MIDMTPDYAVRFYSLIEADKRDPVYYSLEESVFHNIFPGLKFERQLGNLIIFSKDKAKKYLSNLYGVRTLEEIKCLPLTT